MRGALSSRSRPADRLAHPWSGSASAHGSGPWLGPMAGSPAQRGCHRYWRGKIAGHATSDLDRKQTGHPPASHALAPDCRVEPGAVRSSSGSRSGTVPNRNPRIGYDNTGDFGRRRSTSDCGPDDGNGRGRRTFPGTAGVGTPGRRGGRARGTTGGDRWLGGGNATAWDAMTCASSISAHDGGSAGARVAVADAAWDRGGTAPPSAHRAG